MLRALFGPNKPLSNYKRHPDDYFAHVYIDKGFNKAIDYLAFEARKSKKAMVHELLGISMTKYISGKIAEYNRQVIAAREEGHDPQVSRFIRMLRRWVKDQGGDVSKFF